MQSVAVLGLTSVISDAAMQAQAVPFRETHHISGAAVKLAEDKGCTLFDLTVDDLKAIHPLFEADVSEVRGTPLHRSCSSFRGATASAPHPDAAGA